MKYGVNERESTWCPHLTVTREEKALSCSAFTVRFEMPYAKVIVKALTSLGSNRSYFTIFRVHQTRGFCGGSEVFCWKYEPSLWILLRKLFCFLLAICLSRPECERRFHLRSCLLLILKKILLAPVSVTSSFRSVQFFVYSASLCPLKWATEVLLLIWYKLQRKATIALKIRMQVIRFDVCNCVTWAVVITLLNTTRINQRFVVPECIQVLECRRTPLKAGNMFLELRPQTEVLLHGVILA
jgi:hypothetical protein